jgi:hypothetical protein
MKREPQTIGEIGRLIDVSLDHGSRAWYALLHEMGITPEPPDKISDNYEPGTVIYHLGAFLKYVERAYGGFRNIGVATDGQLCPYQDCCWMCGFSAEGCYLCPNCKRPFMANSSDSDYEDWNTCEPELGQEIDPEWAQDLGPSWGTPEGNPARKP